MEKRCESLINVVKRTIEENGLLKQGDRVLVGCSGGADSVALVEILRTLARLNGWGIYVCHVNHNLRGSEAQEDALWVGNFCRMRGLDFCVENVDVPKLIAQGRYSPEEAARVLRYQALRKVAESQACACIAVAHNRDDNAETVMMNVLRCSALDGLTGMKNGNGIIRPLLLASRAQIEEFCRQQKISFRTDSSNRDKKYLRNRVRLELFPYLQKYNPSIVDTLCRSADILSADAEFLNAFAQEKFAALAVADEDGLRLPLQDFACLPRSIATRVVSLAIAKMLKADTEKYINSKHILKVQQLAVTGRTGAVLDLPGDLKVKKDYGELIFSTKPFVETKTICLEQINLPVPGRVVLPDGQVLRASIFCGGKPKVNDVKKAIFPAEVADAGLLVRGRRAGDFFQPSGMNGSKQKLKEFFIDSKLPVAERDNVPLVCDEQGILWVAGMRSAHRERSFTDRWLYLELIKEYLDA